jgi:hypothetical protein
MISFCPTFLLLMCWMTRSSAATEDGHHREDFASVLTLFREVMKLAKSAASGDCHCSKSDQFSSGVAEQQKRILKVFQEFNELIDSESASAARVNRESEEHRPHKRMKRFHYDFRRRMAFPPGTKISVTPTSRKHQIFNESILRTKKQMRSIAYSSTGLNFSRATVSQINK